MDKTLWFGITLLIVWFTFDQWRTHNRLKREERQLRESIKLANERMNHEQRSFHSHHDQTPH